MMPMSSRLEFVNLEWSNLGALFGCLIIEFIL